MGHFRHSSNGHAALDSMAARPPAATPQSLDIYRNFSVCGSDFAEDDDRPHWRADLSRVCQWGRDLSRGLGIAMHLSQLSCSCDFWRRKGLDIDLRFSEDLSYLSQDAWPALSANDQLCRCGHGGYSVK